MKTLSIYLVAAALLTGACAPVTPGDTTPLPPGDSPVPCRADLYQGYLGRNRSTLPTQPADEVWRVTCTTCAVTMDYNPRRLNILFDETTGVIREVKCG